MTVYFVENRQLRLSASIKCRGVLECLSVSSAILLVTHAAVYGRVHILLESVPL